MHFACRFLPPTATRRLVQRQPMLELWAEWQGMLRPADAAVVLQSGLPLKRLESVESRNRVLVGAFRTHEEG